MNEPSTSLLRRALREFRHDVPPPGGRLVSAPRNVKKVDPGFLEPLDHHALLCKTLAALNDYEGTCQ